MKIISIILKLCLLREGISLKFCQISRKHALCGALGRETLFKSKVSFSYPKDDAERNVILDAFNRAREKLVIGELDRANGFLPKASDMIKLKWCSDCEDAAWNLLKTCEFQKGSLDCCDCLNTGNFYINPLLYKAPVDESITRPDMNSVMSSIIERSRFFDFNCIDKLTEKCLREESKFIALTSSTVYRIGCAYTECADKSKEGSFLCFFNFNRVVALGKPLYKKGDPCLKCARNAKCETDSKFLCVCQKSRRCTRPSNQLGLRCPESGEGVVYSEDGRYNYADDDDIDDGVVEKPPEDEGRYVYEEDDDIRDEVVEYSEYDYEYDEDELATVNYIKHNESIGSGSSAFIEYGDLNKAAASSPNSPEGNINEDAELITSNGNQTVAAGGNNSLSNTEPFNKGNLTNNNNDNNNNSNNNNNNNNNINNNNNNNKNNSSDNTLSQQLSNNDNNSSESSMAGGNINGTSFNDSNTNSSAAGGSASPGNDSSNGNTTNDSDYQNNNGGPGDSSGGNDASSNSSAGEQSKESDASQNEEGSDSSSGSEPAKKSEDAGGKAASATKKANKDDGKGGGGGGADADDSPTIIPSYQTFISSFVLHFILRFFSFSSLSLSE